MRAGEHHSDDTLPVLYADDRRYVTTRRIGKGSTANIYLAVDPSGRQVALKVLKPDSAVRPRAFMREADRLQALRRKERELFPDRPHSAFPEVLDRDPAERFFVAEVALGRPLARIFSHRQLIRPDQAVGVAIAIGEALQVVAALGLRNRDLKSDAIFWDPNTGRVIVVDWNAVGQAERSGGVWLTTDVRVTASYLDALLAGGEHTAEWSAPFTTPPPRWTQYYRALRLALEDLLRFPGEADLDGFLSTLRAVESMLSDRPDQLLDFVAQCLLDARSEASEDVRAGLAEQALAAVEIGLQTDHRPTLMRGQALQGQAEDIQREGDVIVQLWASISTEETEASFEAGESLESLRLRTLAAFARRAPGYVDEAQAIAGHFARLEWQLALAGITSLAKRLEPHSDVEALLQTVEAEARGLSGAYVAMEAIESGDRERARLLLADGLAALASARHSELLLARFTDLRRLFDELEPAPSVARVDDISVGLSVLRRQFVVDGSVDPAALAELGDGETIQVFNELIRAWDEVDQSGSKETGEMLVSALVYALKMSAGQRGSIPLARSLPALGRAATGFEARIGGVNLDEARSAATDAENLRDALATLADSIAESDLPEDWLVEARPFVQGWLARGTSLVTRTQEALQSLTLYRRGLDELGESPPLVQRIELLLRLERRRPEDRTIGDLLVGARRRVEEALRAGQRGEDLLAARTLLFPKAAAARVSVPPPPAVPRSPAPPPTPPPTPSVPHTAPPVQSARRAPRRRPGDTSWVSVSVLAAASAVVLAFHWAANRAPADRTAHRGLQVAQSVSAGQAKTPRGPQVNPPPSTPIAPAADRKVPVGSSSTQPPTVPPTPSAPSVSPDPSVPPLPTAPVAVPKAPSSSDAPRPPAPPESTVDTSTNRAPPDQQSTASASPTPVGVPVTPSTLPKTVSSPPPKKAKSVKAAAKASAKSRSRRRASTSRSASKRETKSTKPNRFATSAKDQAAIRMARERARALREKLGRGAPPKKAPAKAVRPTKTAPPTRTKPTPKTVKPPAKTTASPGYLTDDW